MITNIPTTTNLSKSALAKSERLREAGLLMHGFFLEAVSLRLKRLSNKNNLRPAPLSNGAKYSDFKTRPQALVKTFFYLMCARMPSSSSRL